MNWGEEIEEKPFAKDVEGARQAIANIERAAASTEPTVVYEFEKWWDVGKDLKPIKHQVKVNPADTAEVTRYQNIAGMLRSYVKDSNRHHQIGKVLKRIFEENK